MPGDVIVQPIIHLLDLTFDTSQDLLILGVLISISAVETGEEPHDGAADQCDRNRNPHRFHKSRLLLRHGTERGFDFFWGENPIVGVGARKVLNHLGGSSEP